MDKLTEVVFERLRGGRLLKEVNTALGNLAGEVLRREARFPNEPGNKAVLTVVITIEPEEDYSGYFRVESKVKTAVPADPPGVDIAQQGVDADGQARLFVPEIGPVEVWQTPDLKIATG